MDRNVLRIGGGAAMVGAVLGLVFNVMHPRPDDFTVRGELEMVAGSGIWLFDHFMLAWSLAFALVGLVAIAWSFRRGASSAWGRFALASAVGGITLAFITVTVDGMAMKNAADEWAASGNAADFAAARAVADVSLALFTGLMGSLFGLTPVLYGIAILSGDEYPQWLGYLAVAAGALGLLAGSIQYLGGISALTANVLFPVSSIAFTVWAFAMGWRLWTNPAPAPAEEARAAVAA